MCFTFKHLYRNKYMALRLSVILSQPVLFSLTSLCILWEAVVWSTFNGFVRDILDFSRKFDTVHVCVCGYKFVCLLDCPILQCFSTSVTHTQKPLDSTQNPEAENFEAESTAIDRLPSCSAHLSTLDLWYSTELLCSYFCTFTYTHFDFVTLSDLCSPHMGASVFGCMRGTGISELPQISASLIGSSLFVPAALWMLLMPLAHCLGVAFLSLETNRRLLWLLQHQWHSWLVPFAC